MDAAELKLMLFRKIDGLGLDKFQEVYGLLENYLKAVLNWLTKLILKSYLCK